MATVEKVIIEYDVNDKELDKTLDKMVRLGNISKKQAAQFRSDSKTIQEANKKRNQLIQDEIEDLTELRIRKEKAFDAKDVKEYNKRIAESEQRIKGLGKETKKQSDSFISMNKIARNLGGVLVATFSISQIKQFTDESIRLSRQVVGVRNEFSKLDNANLLKNLRKATRGTVSDLELMRRAVQADQLNIPIERLGKLFEFASARALQTGKDVDEFTERIVAGLGRGSVRVLDDLGLSLVEIRQEVEKTGDFSEAAIQVMINKLEETGEVLDTDATIAAHFNSALENLQATIGEKLSPGVAKLQESNTAWLEGLTELIKEHGIFDSVLALITGNQKVLAESFEKNTKAIDENEISMQELNKRIFESVNGEEKRKISAKQQAKLDREAAKALKERFEAYVKIQKALGELEFSEEKRVEVLDDLIAKSKEHTATINVRAQAEIDEKNRIRRIDDELLDAAEERDLKEAERFDKNEKNIQDKKDAIAQREKDRQLAILEAEQEIAQARRGLIMSLLDLSLVAAGQSAEAQNALLSFNILASIANIRISLQEEIAKNSATLGTPAAIPFNTAARLRAATGIAQVLATTIPQFQFAEGVIDLMGKGTGTSDSIPAWLSRGESVMTHKETKEHKPLLQAIRGNRYEEFITQTYIMPAVKKIKVETAKSNEFNDANLIDSNFRSRMVLKDILKEAKKSNEHKLSVR